MKRRKFIEECLLKVIFEKHFVAVDLPEEKDFYRCQDLVRKVAYTMRDGAADIGISRHITEDGEQMLIYLKGEVEPWYEKIQRRNKEKKAEQKG